METHVQDLIFRHVTLSRKELTEETIKQMLREIYLQGRIDVLRENADTSKVLAQGFQSILNNMSDSTKQSG